ncbi:unnamed protein product [Lactuca saligna]|uniref:Uncharacterized protein n=1 Tax=Lactuca saligna TaxID=75948 RepID=A0AA36E3G6_LACSI|nr:unnamed protein product [Lactuca saligna]
MQTEVELTKQLRRGWDSRQEGLRRRSLFFSGSIGIHSRRGRKDFGPLFLSAREEELGGKQSQGWFYGARGSLPLLLRGIHGCLFLVFLTGNECRCVLTIQLTIHGCLFLVFLIGFEKANIDVEKEENIENESVLYQNVLYYNV